MKKRCKKIVLNVNAGIVLNKNTQSCDGQEYKATNFAGDRLYESIKKSIEVDEKDQITIELDESQDGVLTINVVKTNINNHYSENYDNPIIPDGYEYVCGEWNNGFVIQRKEDGSQFVWIPAGSLDANGTLDGVNFGDKFGRRPDAGNRNFSGSCSYNEFQTDELVKQIESVKKYGGFYVSRFYISINEDKKIQAVGNVNPSGNMRFGEAIKIAESFEQRENIKSHMLYASEYDTMEEWFIKTNAEKVQKQEKINGYTTEVIYMNNVWFYNYYGMFEWTNEDYAQCGFYSIRYKYVSDSKEIRTTRFTGDGFERNPGIKLRIALYLK